MTTVYGYAGSFTYITAVNRKVNGLEDLRIYFPSLLTLRQYAGVHWRLEAAPMLVVPRLAAPSIQGP